MTLLEDLAAQTIPGDGSLRKGRLSGRTVGAEGLGHSQSLGTVPIRRLGVAVDRE